jgi:hypothetical protein
MRLIYLFIVQYLVLDGGHPSLPVSVGKLMPMILNASEEQCPNLYSPGDSVFDNGHDHLGTTIGQFPGNKLQHHRVFYRSTVRFGMTFMRWG